MKNMFIPKPYPIRDKIVDENGYTFLTNFQNARLELYKKAIIGFDALIKQTAHDALGKAWDGCSLWVKTENVDSIAFWENFDKLDKE